MRVREREIEKDGIEPLSAQSGESIGQDGGVGDLKTVQRPFGKEILRQLRVDGIIFNKKQFDHAVSLSFQFVARFHGLV